MTAKTEIHFCFDGVHDLFQFLKVGLESGSMRTTGLDYEKSEHNKQSGFFNIQNEQNILKFK